MELQGQIDIFSTEQKPRMNVLIACEESQEVCKAFRLRGHRAFSCDLQECSGGHPEWHIQCDCLSLINGNCTFKTADTHTHTQVGQWDLLIAHPPCTYLSNAGANSLYKKINGKSYVDSVLDGKTCLIQILQVNAVLMICLVVIHEPHKSK